MSKNARYLTKALANTGALAKWPKICPKCKIIGPKWEEILLKLLNNCQKLAKYLAISRTSGSYRMFGQSRISAFFDCRRFGRIIGRIVGWRFCRRKIRFNTGKQKYSISQKSLSCLLLYTGSGHGKLWQGNAGNCL